MGKTYVVFIGRKPGIYTKWSEAHAQVYRFPGACYQGYDSRIEAYEAWDKRNVPEPPASGRTCTSSTSTATSTGRTNASQKLARLLVSQADITSQIRDLCVKMEKIVEEIKREVDPTE